MKHFNKTIFSVFVDTYLTFAEARLKLQDLPWLNDIFQDSHPTFAATDAKKISLMKDVFLIRI